MTTDGFLFVSHVSEDGSTALEIVHELERRGIPCWIAPRNVNPGRPFDNEIADAIETSLAMLLVFSDRCNESEYIRREVTVAGDAGKVIIPFRIEDVRPKSGLRVRLSDLHWIDAFVSRERAIEELVKTVRPPEPPPVAARSAVSRTDASADRQGFDRDAAAAREASENVLAAATEYPHQAKVAADPQREPEKVKFFVRLALTCLGFGIGGW